MKQNLRFILLTLLCAVVTGAWATDVTGKIQFGSATGSTKIDDTEVKGYDSEGNTWTITTVTTAESFTQNANYSQVGAASKPATSITFTTTLSSSQTITAFEAKFGGFSGTKGTITMKVDNTTVGSGSLDATNDVTVSSTSSATGTVLTVTVTDIEKGVKCYYISYTYDDGTVVNVATPTFSPKEGSYYESQSVSISCETEGATIYYTLDKTEPSKSSTKYTGPITIDKTTTIKAIAYNDDGDASEVATATYTIIPNVTNISAFKALDNNTVATLTLNNARVLNTKGNYMVVADATGGIVFFKTNLDYSQFATLNGTITAKYSLYNGTPELTEVAKNNLTVTNGDAIEPTDFTTVNATTENICRYYYKMSNVTLSGSDKTFTATFEDGETIEVYNNFGYTLSALQENAKYNVYGVLGYYQRGNTGTAKYQFWPIADFEEAEAKADPELTFNPNAIKLEVGEQSSIIEIRFPNDLSSSVLNFENSDETVASYTFATKPSHSSKVATETISLIYVKGLALGTCTITVTSDETDKYKVGKAVLTVTVVDPSVPAEFHETFDNVLATSGNPGTGGNDGEWNGSIASVALEATTCDMQGWTFENAYAANNCVKLGKSSSGKGIATTPALGIEGDATFTFKAGAWDHQDEDNRLFLQVNGEGLIDDGEREPSDDYAVLMEPGKWTTYTLKLKDMTPESTITFSSAIATKNRFFLDEISIVEKASITIDISPVGYATLYYSDKSLEVPEGVVAKAYGMNGDKLEVVGTISKGEVIPKGTGVVLEATTKKDEIQSFEFLKARKPATPDWYNQNYLMGSDDEVMTDKTDEIFGLIDFYFYMLSTNQKGENPGFYWGANNGAAFMNGAHKAFLAIPKSSGVNASSFVFDNLTGIRAITNDYVKNAEGVHTLSGIRMDGKQLPKGIYIVNGKKVVIK